MSLHISYSNSKIVIKDTDLWSDFKSGSREAFSKIYYDNAEVLLDYALKITSDRKLIEDCMQEMFIYLWENKHKLNEVQMIRNYLFTALRRRVLKALKGNKILFSSEALNSTPQFELPIEGTLILEQEDLEKKEKIYSILNKLSPLQKEIIYLKYFNSFTFEEIAEILKTNKKTVYNALAKAMTKFRKTLITLIFILTFF